MSPEQEKVLLEHYETARNKMFDKRLAACTLRDSAAQDLASITRDTQPWRIARFNEEADAKKLQAAVFEIEAKAEEALLKALFTGIYHA